MKFMLTKKDIVALNQQFEETKVSNEASLDFALSYARRTTNWQKALAYLVRAILIDHVFEDGNKRAVALLIKTYADMEGHQTSDSKIANMIKKILLKNITSIKKIEEMIQDVIE